MSLFKVGTDIWSATQPLRAFGIEVGSRMTVVCLSDQSLVLISPIALDGDLVNQITQLGSVSHIIAPNLFHHLFLDVAQHHFPEARLLGVPGLPEKRTDLSFNQLLDSAGHLGNTLAYLPFRGFQAWRPNGFQIYNEVVFCHYPSKSLIITDIAANFNSTAPLMTRLTATILGSYNHLRPSRLEKWGTQDKTEVETSVRKVLEWSFDRVIPGHGEIVESNGRELFRIGYEWFLNRSIGPT
jgi:hypothetical protein